MDPYRLEVQQGALRWRIKAMIWSTRIERGFMSRLVVPKLSYKYYSLPLITHLRALNIGD